MQARGGRLGGRVSVRGGAVIVKKHLKKKGVEDVVEKSTVQMKPLKNPSNSSSLSSSFPVPSIKIAETQKKKEKPPPEPPPRVSPLGGK